MNRAKRNSHQNNRNEVQQNKREEKGREAQNKQATEMVYVEDTAEKIMSVVKKRLNNIKRKRKNKMPKKRSKVKIRIGKDRGGEVESNNIQEINKEDIDQRATEDDYSEGEIESKNAKDGMDQQQQDNEHVKLSSENKHDNEEMHKEGTRDNIKARSRENDCETMSSSLPSDIKNHPGINLVVDLDDNIPEIYRSQEEMENYCEEEETEFSKSKERKEYKFENQSQDESDAQ
ncbi:uncharacterized protein LOC132053853 [Lycium ferocissimum]|uniref:uncharacterized protein LOC132053853 n=1 Tax=Lycium ferocissimum TaxID=112874 RepID=UPI002814E7C1|nr:uncharacterized protein LOC132053853 [Lycium ferocissimum]